MAGAPHITTMNEVHQEYKHVTGCELEASCCEICSFCPCWLLFGWIYSVEVIKRENVRRCIMDQDLLKFAMFTISCVHFILFDEHLMPLTLALTWL